ncbi:MAG: cation transporter [Deltaproteobacteria bacterium]|nr:cation transporter [Deltaproteobacteria bacterium]
MTNPPTVSATSRNQLLRRGLRLESLTIVWNVVEAVIAVGAGSIAGSVALVGFGLDSVIETLAGAALYGRLRAELRGTSLEVSEIHERRALWIVGVTFLLLGAYILYEAGETLWLGQAPERSIVGMLVAAVSLALMPALGWAKYRTGLALGSRALLADAKETLVCVYLSLTLLVGLGLNAWLGWWWADPVAALVMLPFVLHEAWEALEEARGEGED